MATSTLSFGDTFTLPATGDHEWVIRDLRPPFLHLAGHRDDQRTAFASTPHSNASAAYVPGFGWSVNGADANRDEIAGQLADLDVRLPHKSTADWEGDYRRMLSGEARGEVAQIASMADEWSEQDGIDGQSLRAHIAASGACAAAGVPNSHSLFGRVFNATLSTLKEKS